MKLEVAKILYMIANRKALEPVSYANICEEFEERGGNIGNKLFLNAIYQYVNDGENKIHICEVGKEHKLKDYDAQKYSEEYDYAVWPVANFFQEPSLWQINAFWQIVQKLRIPVFFFGAGVQAAFRYDLNILVKRIGKASSRFIDSVLQRGGNFAVRGYYTKEFFDKLGFSGVFVSGCPSMYQNGFGFRINNDKTPFDQFTATVNGNTHTLINPAVKKWFTGYPRCVYVDQDEFAEIIYDSNFFNSCDNKKRYLI